MEEQFKYGSIGAENDQGLPFWICVVLPKMFPEYLPRPGGWASLGLSWEQGRELPVGFSKKTIGFDRVAINCALCHTGRVRKPGEAVPRIYPAGPGNGIDPLGYQRFLFACGQRPALHRRQRARPRSRRSRGSRPSTGCCTATCWCRRHSKALLKRKPRPSPGPTSASTGAAAGSIRSTRSSTASCREAAYGDKPIDEIDDKTIGNSDMQPIWNLRPGSSARWRSTGTG